MKCYPDGPPTPNDAEHKGGFAQQRGACVGETSPARPACLEEDGLEAKLTEGHRADSLRADLPPGYFRTFSMNSREFYEAVCTPRERPWIPNGALPREPRGRHLPVIVERRR